MKKLNHPNIVKYVDTIRTDDYLYIVLEYVINSNLYICISLYLYLCASVVPHRWHISCFRLYVETTV